MQRHNLAPSQSPGLGVLQHEELGEHGAALGAGGLDTCTGSRSPGNGIPAGAHGKLKIKNSCACTGCDARSFFTHPLQKMKPSY